jgi:hypothetical protein
MFRDPKGETITHNSVGEGLVCPCKAIKRRVSYLVQHKQSPVNTTVSILSRRGNQSFVTPRYPQSPSPKPSITRTRQPRHQTRGTRGPLPAGRRHSPTLRQRRQKFNPSPWSLEIGRHDSIPSRFGKPSCTTIRKSRCAPADSHGSIRAPTFNQTTPSEQF